MFTVVGNWLEAEKQHKLPYFDCYPYKGYTYSLETEIKYVLSHTISVA